MGIRQRQPRLRDDGYLKWLQDQPCACCHQAPPCDAAHLRASSWKYGKAAGLGIKPDDRWALPLKRAHHMEQHAYGNELLWWKHVGVKDPFKLCREYYNEYLNELHERRKDGKARTKAKDH